MTETDPGELDVTALRQRLDRAAGHFSDFVHRRCFEGLMDRLLPMTLQPGTIVDLGSASGAGSRALATRFRRARVVSIDFSAGMLQAGIRRQGWFSRVRQVQADARHLPLRSGIADLAVANLLLPYLHDSSAALGEANRVLRRDGLFLFATLGPSSLALLREAWAEIDQQAHVAPFADMHNVGDALVRAGLRDPVLDVEELKITYRDTGALMADLTAAGARNTLVSRQQGLTGKTRFGRFLQALESRRVGGLLTVNLELVFGHAWGGGGAGDAGEYRLSPADIGRRRR